MKKYKSILSFFIIYIIISMMIFPKVYISKTLEGISAWAFNVLPSILPFIFFTKILSATGMIEKWSSIFQKPCHHLYKTKPISAYVFLMSIISGYPVGAKMTADLYSNKQISKNDAVKMCSFCSTSGPMFIIGAIGTTMLKSTRLGYLIFLSHILGALLNGILYRNLKIKEDENFKVINNNQQKFDFSSMVLDSVLSILSVGAIIAIFFVVITSLMPLINLLPQQFTGVLEGFIEITKGSIDISASLTPFFQVLGITFVVSFGGISGILQSYAMLDKINIPIKLLVLQKFTQALLSVLVALPLCLLFI